MNQDLKKKSKAIELLNSSDAFVTIYSKTYNDRI